ncbi:MAG TPA: ABC transporter permease [Solirubrobacteraceae bacterium]|nr:ABC transporter permease [Solirubrobacteraceae bacterium]
MSPEDEELEVELAGDEHVEAALRSPARLNAYVRGLGGAVVPILTTVIAFVVAGLVVLITGHDPLSTYKAVFNGTGLNWLFPWISGSARTTAALELQQTLIETTALILVGLAVAFAFRAGLFNIGGQGQYTVGAIVAVWIGSSLSGMTPVLHITLAIVAAALAGAAWAGIAGVLKATLGVHEVISTIMLNWIAVWLGVYLFQLGGPLQDPAQSSVPVSKTIAASAKLPVFWGNPNLQGLDIGIFIALALVVVFGVIINRTRLGYEVRAVGFNPDAASYAGMNVGRSYVKVMLFCGAFAGVAAALDILGWKFQLFTNDIQASQIGFLGIAVALLGRNTAIGTVAAALLFGSLLTGTSERNLDPTVFDPNLAQYLTYMIQGLIVLLVSTDLIALRVLRSGRGIAVGLRRRRPDRAEAAASADGASTGGTP